MGNKLTTKQILDYMKELLSEIESDFQIADGADSNFHQLEGNVEVLEHLIGKIESGNLERSK